jgi:hypothetical protein
MNRYQLGPAVLTPCRRSLESRHMGCVGVPALIDHLAGGVYQARAG